ncbi:MAG: hypothetical protein QXN71_04025 [Candidatus Aenigmatarchaeota archaeon]
MSGYYTIYDDPSVFVYCIKPAYLGLQDAMSFHNLWEQETSPIIITTRKVVPGTRVILGSNVGVRRIQPKHFFGYDYVKWSDGFFLPVSDIEKTSIDMVYFRELRKDMIKLFRNKIDADKLKKYLKAYKRRFAKTVLKIYIQDVRSDRKR